MGKIGMKCILGKKIKMTQIWAEDGRAVPVTVISAGPCTVAQVKNAEKDGYSAVQMGFGKKKKLNKPLAGHLKDLAQFQWLREFGVDSKSELKRGDVIDVSVFVPGDKVKVTGTSKGRGFQGVVKRHGFHGSPATHGHKDQLRMPGSIGATDPQRVFKGMRMGGHMGMDRITVPNLEIVAVNKENNQLMIKGAVPGARGSLVMVVEQ